MIFYLLDLLSRLENISLHLTALLDNCNKAGQKGWPENFETKNKKLLETLS